MQVPNNPNVSENKIAAADALWLLGRLVQEFPGILDMETEVSGSDIVDWLTLQIQELDGAKAWMKRFYSEPKD